MLNYKFSTLNRMDMGSRILKARKSVRLSQEKLGKRIGVSKGAISQWENGDVKNLKMENLFALEDATGFSARWIALEQGPERVDSTPFTPEEFDSKRQALGPEEITSLLRLAADQLSSQENTS